LASIVKDVVETVVSKREEALSHRPAWAVTSAMLQIKRKEIVTVIIVCFMDVNS